MPSRAPGERHAIRLPASRSAHELFVDYDQIASDAAAMLRLEAGRNPHDKALIELVGELSIRSALFRRPWASQEVRYHGSGRKRLRHPALGQLDLCADPGDGLGPGRRPDRRALASRSSK